MHSNIQIRNMSRKNFCKKSLRFSMCTILSSVLAIACVNHLDDETQVGTIPINFSVKIDNKTRVTNNQFEKGDKAGLFGPYQWRTLYRQS